MYKNKFFLFMILFLAINLFAGCNEIEPEVNNRAKIEECYDLIEMLPDIKDIKGDSEILEVKAAKRAYNALDDSEKAEITNYDKLEEALKKVTFLEGLDDLFLEHLGDVYALIDDAIPSSVDGYVGEIALPKSYILETEYKNYTYYITYECSDMNVISKLGVVNHGKQACDVTLYASIECPNGYSKLYEKNVHVERSMNFMFDHSIVVAYWYGRYMELTDVDLETIDVINYSFAQIAKDDNGNWIVEGSGLRNLAAFQKLKEKGIKICLSLGGWHDDRSFWNTYAEAARTDASRKAVAKAILETMKKYDLDGVDMDWEYPTSSDKTNFTLLMKEIKKTLKAENPNYLITAAIPAGSWIGSQFDLGALNDALDYFYIMSYDLDDGMNCNHLSSLGDAKDAVEFFKKSGVDKEKLVIGSAFYGRVYEGVPNVNNGLGQKASNKNEISYTKIKSDYLSRLGKGVEKYYDSKEEAYYLYDSENNIYITYEDIESVTEKWDYVMESGIAGLMYWSYNNDTTNTLMKAIYDAQNK